MDLCFGCIVSIVNGYSDVDVNSRIDHIDVLVDVTS